MKFLSMFAKIAIALPGPGEHLQRLGHFLNENWAACMADRRCRYIVLAIAGASGATAALFLLPFLLAALGFGSLGPVAGSLAALYQSTYGVNAVFALLQSLGMAGLSKTAWVAILVMVSNMAALAGSWYDQTTTSSPSRGHDIDTNHNLVARL